MFGALQLITISLLTPLLVFADTNVTGLWTGTTTVSNGGGVYQNTFTLIQSGSAVTGGTPPDQNGGCSYSGNVTGDQISLFASCPNVNYTSSSTATLNATFDSMAGTFSDSQGTTGTFEASKQKNNLVKGIAINEPPLVVISGKNVNVSLLKFDGVQAKVTKAAEVLAAKGAPKINYEVTLKGAEKRKLTTKKTEVTLKNLKSGNYTLTYKVIAIKDDKVVQSSKKSPTASFVVN